MKKIFSILFVMAAIVMVGCQTVDLSPLEKRVSELESIVHNLQEISLTGDYVTDIQPLTENGKIVGYIVTFNEHGTYTVRNGKDGDPGAPGDPGDPGAPGEDGDTWFADVTVTEDTVVFTLDDANHTQFVIPRAGAAADFGLIIENRQLAVSMGGQKVKVPFTIKGGDDQTVVSVLATEGYKATVEGDKIIIVAPEEPVDAQIWAVAENGAGKSSVVVLRITVQEAQIIVPDKSKWTVLETEDRNVIIIDLGGESSISALVLGQSTEIAGATLPSKFSLATTMDGEEWEDALVDQPLAGRGGSQVFELGKFVNATMLKVTLSEPFEADLPVKQPAVDAMCGEDATCELVPMVEVPVLRNATPPFETDGVGHANANQGDRWQYLYWWNCTQSTWGITFDTASGMPCFWAAAAWATSDTVNGKNYQTLDFEPGYYSFDATIHGADDPYDVDIFIFAAKGEGGDDGVNLPSIDAEGTFLPNDNTLSYLKVDEIDGHSEPVVASVSFKVETAGKISVGYLGNTYSAQHVGQDSAGNWVHIWGFFGFKEFAVSGK